MASQKTLVCFGDSLTEGAIGASYVDILRERLPAAVRVINAGINGDTTINLLRRYERDVVPYRPDLVVILVGLNDLTTVYGWPSNRAYYRYIKRVPIGLTPTLFARAYQRLISKLRERTSSQLALCTLTTVGERLDDPFQVYVEAYSTVIRALAQRERLPLIDLRGAFRTALAQEPRDGPAYHIWTPLLDWAAIGLRGRTYAELGERRGYRLLCDGAHLAEAGAELVAETMLPFLRTAL
ncbi:MAG TPA: GDSL-type esterase/lipase family protein [Roseiflexaceae bacterium]|nr:GDSL-type esterase/lipase family protein [Roseiflexaceae bacterium]